MSTNLQKENITPDSLTDKFDPAAPVIYADQLMGMTSAPFVSKLVFGVEDNHNRTRKSVVTVVLPTNTLHDVLSQLLSSISTDETRDLFKRTFDGYLNGPSFEKK